MAFIKQQLKNTKKILKVLLGLLPLAALITGIIYSINMPEKKIAVNKKSQIVFQYGIIKQFINGAYLGNLSVKEVKSHGNFGLGAPNQVNGELTFYNGRVYQTLSSGLTVESADSLKTPFSMVTNFKPSKYFYIDTATNIGSLFNQIEGKLKEKDHIYAIRISGHFNLIATRAFEPVKIKPYKPLVELMNTQHVFHYKNTQGILVGFYMPEHLSGISVDGLHFHFLSNSKKQGGHALIVQGHQLKVDYQESDMLCVQSPASLGFRDGKQRGGLSDLDIIEKGG